MHVQVLNAKPICESELTATLFWGLEPCLSFRVGERVKNIVQHREAE